MKSSLRQLVGNLLRCLVVVPCALAAGDTLNAAAATPPFRADRIMVMPKPGLPLENMAALHAATGARVLHQFAGIENLQILQLPPQASPKDFVARYQQSGLASFAELDLAIRIAVSPNDPYYTSGLLWHLHNTSQAGADIHAPEGWDALRTASNIIVAVVDTGVRYTHQDLAPNIWVNSGEIPGNGIDDDGDGFVDDVHGINAAANTGDPMDTLGHGTQVAGYIGAVGNNSLGVVGVAWRVQIMACRFFDDAGNGNISDVIQCFDYARIHGAKVINASFVSTGYSSSFYTAINSCRSAGIILVAAAGNDTVNTDATPYYPACYNLDNIVSVAATTSTDGLASFSNYGATSVDLGAPGLYLYSTARDSDSAYVQNSGTSFSSPIVAGAIALMRARYPAETYRQQIDRVFAAVDPLPALAGKCVTGGRLNLARALGPGIFADFAMSASSGALPLAVTFTNNSFGAITNWQWQFGDGTGSAAQNPSHTYTNPGTFIVTLTVKNDLGQTSTTNRTLLAVANYQMTNATFSWIDPASMTSLGLVGDDVSVAQALPFPFQFYGQAYSSLYVGANGLMGFSSDGLSSSANTDLPDATAPNNILCPFWDDLAPSATSVHLGTVGIAPNRKVVISWVSAAASGGGPPASFTFQVVLAESSNTILFQYLNADPGSRNNSAAGKRATVGVEHSSGLVARKYSYNGSTLLANNQAILFSPTSSSPAVNSSPTVAITNLANGTTLTAPASFAIAASASDGDGSVAQVEFFLGGTSAGVDLTSPYTASVTNLSAGNYMISAVASDNAGAKATNSVNLIVNNPPTVTLTNPTDGWSFAAPANISIAATAGDSDGTVTNVEFFQGATKLGQDASSPFNFAWNSVAAGSYILTARATDNRGATTISALINISVTNSPPSPVTLVNPGINASGFTFSFLTMSVRSYTVQFNGALGSTNWQTLTNLSGNGAMAIITDPDSGATQRFYRVVSQ